MRKVKKISYMALLACFIFMLTACTPPTVSSGSDEPYSFDWTKGVLVPFSGYLCAYENTDIFLQIPMVYQKTESNMINGTISMEFTNSLGESLVCAPGGFSLEQVVGEYKMATLKLHANFAKAGTYEYDKLIVTFNGKSYLYELGTLFFDIIPKTNEDLIECSEIRLTNVDLAEMKITYTNTSNDDIEITGFTYYDAAVEAAPNFSLYTNYEYKEKSPEGNVIPAGESRAVYLSQQQKSETEGECLLYLPFVEYTANGKLYKMPAQFQATAVQPPFTDEYLFELMQSGAMQEIE